MAPPVVMAMALVVPVLVLMGLCAGCHQSNGIDAETLKPAFEKIHRNIYSIYKLHDGSAVYDRLAESCAGRELEREVFAYLKCLQVQQELKTFVTIVDVIYNDIRVLKCDQETAEIYCKWIVIGKVRHPTHIHRRVNLNEALYEVVLLGDKPKIVGYDLLTNQAVDTDKQ